MRRSHWAVAARALFVLCASAGAGLLTAALTMEPPRPPQPDIAAMVAPVQPAAPVEPAAPVTVQPEPSIAAAPQEVAVLPRSAPLKIKIPAVKVQAEVVPVGVDKNDELEVPALEKAMQVGWWKLGVSPGEPGNAIMIGHVDSYKIGRAVFFDLGRLKPGDTIEIVRKDDSKVRFKVDSVQSYLKTEFPTDTVYGHQETPGLRLITCGGKFDKKSREYLSNVVVFATLTSPAG